MRRSAKGLSVVLALALSLVASSGVRAATCTITQMSVILRSLGITAPLPGAAGVALPVTVDEATGTISFDFAGFPAQTFITIGVQNDLSFPGPTTTFAGTLDGGGNIAIPNVKAVFSTTYTTPPTEVPITAPLATGLQTTTVQGVEYPTHGAALDFGTGALTLEGQGSLTDAPGLNAAVTTGLRVACNLAPVPDKTKLAKAGSLAAANGAGKLAKASGTLKGDKLTKLTATFVPGTGTIDPTAVDLFVTLTGGNGEDVLLVHVPAGTLTAKGKTFVASDTDGSNVRVLRGQKKQGETSAPLAGKLTAKQSKKGLTLTLTESGIDLSTLASGPATVTVGVGSGSASRSVHVKATKRGLTFK